jgi:hypothetical protein
VEYRARHIPWRFSYNSQHFVLKSFKYILSVHFTKQLSDFWRIRPYCALVRMETAHENWMDAPDNWKTPGKQPAHIKGKLLQPGLKNSFLYVSLLVALVVTS